MSADDVLLRVEDLQTHFFLRRGIVKAVDGVGFTLRRGETLGLVGESGCGKTVTGLSILRLVPEPPGRIVGGRILFEGEDLLKHSSSNMRKIRGRKISMILQDPMTSLNPAFNIGDQVGEAIRLHQKLRGKRLVEKVIEALRLVKIPAPESRLRSYPHQMSGGMRQRVSGAIAFSCKPSLFIADEPTTNLDVTIQAQYLKLLEELRAQTGASFIFITHDFGIVAKICDKVAVMYAGRIVERAQTAELFDRPSHPYTQALMACLPKIDGRRGRLNLIEGQLPDLTDMPPGCSFAPRCSAVVDICRQSYPDEVRVGPDHHASCWRLQGAR